MSPHHAASFFPSLELSRKRQPTRDKHLRSHTVGSKNYLVMKPAIQNHLEFLYGRKQAVQLEGRLAALVEEHRERIRAYAPAPGKFLAPEDALLITYADQVREPDRAPLQTLADFAAQHLQGIVSGVHILPFYPWSSDDGFSVK